MSKNYVKELNTYLFRKSWGELFSALSDEDTGKLVKAIYSYGEGAESYPENINKPLLSGIYKMIIGQLNSSSKKHLKRLAEKAAADQDKSPDNSQDIDQNSGQSISQETDQDTGQDIDQDN